MEMAEFYSAEFLKSDEFYKQFDAKTYIDTPIHGSSEMDICKLGRTCLTVVEYFKKPKQYRVYMNGHELPVSDVKDVDLKNGRITVVLDGDVDYNLVNVDKVD